MGKEYTFVHLGGPSDGRTESRHLSREEFDQFFATLPTPDKPITLPLPGEEPRYQLVDLKNGTFYFEWFTPPPADR